jgi:tRNA A37 threonylcarbamoyladenosine modification protein TsaB
MVSLYIYTFYDETKYWILDDNITIFEKEIKDRQISENFYELFKEANIDFGRINKIIFINGPGSFTSLRFFLTFAKALKVSFPEIKVIPVNLLELMAFTKKGEVDVIMGGNREFLRFFHYGKYKNINGTLEIIEEIRLISYEEAVKINKPLFIGVKPSFPVENYTVRLDDMINFSNYKLKKGNIENIISLTPYYYKQFVTKKV